MVYEGFVELLGDIVLVSQFSFTVICKASLKLLCFEYF